MRAQQMPQRRGGAKVLLAALLALALVAAGGSPALAGGKTHTLRVRNRTPFILLLYVAGVRVGWVKAFRNETIRGLREGYHEVYATSRYGSGYFGPLKVWAPGGWSITPSAGGLGNDAATALVSRIYRENRASLAACDALARKRGEDLDGARVELELKVDKDGRGAVAISGEQLSARLRSCYDAVSRTWSLPAMDEPYTVSFQHVPAAR